MAIKRTVLLARYNIMFVSNFVGNITEMYRNHVEGYSGSGLLYILKTKGDNRFYIATGLSALQDESPTEEFVYLTINSSQYARWHELHTYLGSIRRGYNHRTSQVEYIDDSSRLKVELGYADILDDVLQLLVGCNTKQYVTWSTLLDDVIRILNEKRAVTSRYKQFKDSLDDELSNLVEYQTILALLRKRSESSHSDFLGAYQSDDLNLKKETIHLMGIKGRLQAIE